MENTEIFHPRNMCICHINQIMCMNMLFNMQYQQQSNKIIQEMEQRQLSKSQDKIQKMQSSMIAFRELIESLRVKNAKSIRQPQSQINPQMQSSSHSRLYASQKIPEIKTHTDKNSYTNVFAASASMPAINEDQGLKLKSRGNVAGRDVLNKKPTLVASSKFDQTVSNIKEHARNKNIQTPSSFADEPEPGSHPAVEQIKNILKNNKKNSNNSNSDEQSPSTFFHTNMRQQMFHKSSAQTSNKALNKTSTTMPLTAPKFQQNRLNLKAIAARNKIKDIDQSVIFNYCKQAERLNQHSKADQIFDFFEGLSTQANVAIISPFIKKFKNCIYFGAPILEDQIYEGFLYFYKQKIYYGEFLRNQKHGKGVEVYLQDQAIYKGVFKEGQKSGKFWVKKPEQLYIGFLEKGLYHGQGKLQTKQSVYEGQFENGEKHGFGEESFKKTGVKMTGYFDRGAFSKRSKSSFSHNQLQRGIKFRSNNKQNIHNRIIPNSSKNSRNSNDQKSEEIQNGIRFEQQMNFTNSPFTSNNNSFQPRRTLFNKQKINSFLPGMGQKFIDPMPENCKDFDYSFDASSRRQSQFSYFGNQMTKNRVHQKNRKENYLKIPQISEIQQQQQNHLDTSALQEPLPVPCFYKK